MTLGEAWVRFCHAYSEAAQKRQHDCKFELRMVYSFIPGALLFNKVQVGSYEELPDKFRIEIDFCRSCHVRSDLFSFFEVNICLSELEGGE